MHTHTCVHDCSLSIIDQFVYSVSLRVMTRGRYMFITKPRYYLSCLRAVCFPHSWYNSAKLVYRHVRVTPCLKGGWLQGRNDKVISAKMTSWLKDNSQQVPVSFVLGGSCHLRNVAPKKQAAETRVWAKTQISVWKLAVRGSGGDWPEWPS